MSDGTTAADDAAVPFVMEQCEDDVVVVDAVDNASTTRRSSTELAAIVMAMVDPRLFLFDKPIMRLL